MKKYQSNNFFQSALHAIDGLYLAFRTQKNFRKHLLIAVCILILAFILKLETIEFVAIIVANTVVLVSELINSVIEFVLDAYYKNKHSVLCKFAKDISAGAVLLCAISNAIVAAILMLPKIIDYFI